VPEIIAQAAEQVRPAIAQLPGPDAELVAGIDRGQRRAARQQLVAGEDFGKLRAGSNSGGKPSKSATSR
jgi:hypothetical protein